MITIIGLGNPGNEYEKTRHNAGFIIVEQLRVFFDFPEWKEDKKRVAYVSSGEIRNEKVELMLPLTHMNKSGKSTLPLKGNVKKIEHTLVIHDDLDMPIGSAKMIFNRGDGGHKGVISINKALSSKAYIRIKIGISKSTPTRKIKKPKGDEAVQKYVLGKFSEDELLHIKKIGKGISEAIEILIESGRPKAQTIFNNMF